MKQPLVNIRTGGLALALMVATAAPVEAQDLAEPPGLEPLPGEAPSTQTETPLEALKKDLESEELPPTQTEQVVEEIRVRGRVYMVKVTPRDGATYYLIDRDGDGTFDRRFNEFDKNEFDTQVAIPRWRIGTW